MQKNANGTSGIEIVDEIDIEVDHLLSERVLYRSRNWSKQQIQFRSMENYKCAMNHVLD